MNGYVFHKDNRVVVVAIPQVTLVKNDGIEGLSSSIERLDPTVHGIIVTDEVFQVSEQIPEDVVDHSELFRRISTDDKITEMEAYMANLTLSLVMKGIL